MGNLLNKNALTILFSFTSWHAILMPFLGIRKPRACPISKDKYFETWDTEKWSVSPKFGGSEELF